MEYNQIFSKGTTSLDMVEVSIPLSRKVTNALCHKNDTSHYLLLVKLNVFLLASQSFLLSMVGKQALVQKIKRPYVGDCNKKCSMKQVWKVQRTEVFK